ncbi:hypothetical protein [Modestobacter sp. SYSU DS0290]
MADRVLLHLGTPKSGTTYLQQLLWDNRPALARSGVSYPGWAPEAHFLACQDLCGAAFNDWPDPAVQGSWDRLLRRVRRTPGTVVLSHELFGDATAEVAARALADLAPAEVHLVVTARDLARQLPAVWQEDLKNRHAVPFADFLASADERTGVRTWYGDAFWHRQDVPAVLRRWAGTLPADRVHVVVVPPRGSEPTELWHRFAAILGVEPDVAVPPPARAANSSLGAVEAELLRLLNSRLDGRVPWPVYAERVNRRLAPDVLALRPGPAIVLPPEHHAWVAARSATLVAELTAAGHHVVGDLAELLVPAEPSVPAPVAAPSEEELLDAALDALTWLVAAEHPPPPQPKHPRLSSRVSRRLAVLLDR